MLTDHSMSTDGLPTYRSASARARTLRMWLAVAAVTNGFVTMLLVVQWFGVWGNEMNWDLLGPLGRLRQWVEPVNSLVFFVTAYMFSRWLRAAYENLPALSPVPDFEKPSLSPRQVQWGFFIPFINILRPFRAARETWQHSAPNGQLELNSTLLQVWWVVWSSNYLFLFASSRARVGAWGFGWANDLQWITALDAAGLLSLTVSAVLSILVVREIDARQTARANWLAAMLPGRVRPQED